MISGPVAAASAGRGGTGSALVGSCRDTLPRFSENSVVVCRPAEGCSLRCELSIDTHDSEEPGDLKARMDEAEAVNWSAIAQQAFKEVVINLAARKETATMDDVVERLHASKESYVETEHKAGLAVGEEWAKEAAEYGEVLRIAKAVEEVRREIDVQTLQDLIDPEHKMDPDDWGSFWGLNTPSPLYIC